MNLPKLIGIAGKKQHGKDTAGNYLCRKHGYVRIAFADAIKEMMRHSFGFTEEQLNGSQKEEIDPFWKVSPRQVLQFVGTEMFRNTMPQLIPHVESNFWVIVAKKKMMDEWAKNPDAKFVITDVRFENELDFIHEMGGISLTVFRTQLASTEDTHSSETADLKTQYTIVNDGSLDALYAQVEAVLREIV